MAGVIPLVILVVVELCLRWGAYGHDTHLFITDPDNPSLIVMNQYASARFFSDTVNATKGYAEPFSKEKEKNTLRIVVLGESTAEGYPYFHNGSFHRWLKFRLMHTFPNRKIEVINLALTAVNSYTIRDFSEEVAQVHPDAVLIYVGHNEYYGALGVGSTSNLGSNRTIIKFLLQVRKLKIAQLFQNMIYSLIHSAKNAGTDTRENLMKRMAASQSIPYRSDDYLKGIAQFKENMNDVCSTFHEKNIPVFISTLVANLKDLRPFITDSTNRGITADQYFVAGKLSYHAGDYMSASRDFIRAKELDLLRFRAPEAIDSAIRQLPSKFNNVHLVDSRALFESNEPHHIIGNETLLEHVHPNLFGYALLSDAYYQSLKKYKIIRPDTTQEMPFANLLTKMPVTKVDSLNGAYQIMMLRARWPFNEKIPQNFRIGNSLDEQIAGPLSVNRIDWMTAMNQLFQQSMANNDKATALKAAEAVSLENPSNTTYYIYSARLNYELGNMEESAYYFKRCFMQDPTDQNAMNLSIFYIKTEQPDSALKWADLCLQKNPGNRKDMIMRDLVAELNRAITEGKRGRMTPLLKERIASAYRRLGEQQLAKKYQN